MRNPKTPQITKLINGIKSNGRFVQQGYNKVDKTATSVYLPKGAEIFDWEHSSDVQYAMGKWVQVKRKSGLIEWMQITDFHYEPSNRRYAIYVATGMLRRSDYDSEDECYVERDKYLPSEKKKMKVVAENYVRHGDLFRAITEGYPTHNPKNLLPKYFIFRKSKTFISMANQALKNAFKELKIDENYLLKSRKDIIDSAIMAENFTAAEKALTGLERIFSMSEESDELPQVGYANPDTMAQLLAAKKEQLSSVQEASVISTPPTTDEPATEQ